MVQYGKLSKMGLCRNCEREGHCLLIESRAIVWDFGRAAFGYEPGSTTVKRTKRGLLIAGGDGALHPITEERACKLRQSYLARLSSLSRAGS